MKRFKKGERVVATDKAWEAGVFNPDYHERPLYGVVTSTPREDGVGVRMDGRKTAHVYHASFWVHADDRAVCPTCGGSGIVSEPEMIERARRA